MSGEARCVLLFRSVHDVLAAEKSLKSRGLWCDLIPAPRELSPDCGMAIEVTAPDFEAVERAMAASSTPVVAAFARQGNVFTKLGS